MSPSCKKSDRDLIGELCDGSISQNVISQLGQMLRLDPILQQEYLDQLLIDGLLQYEYGMASTSIAKKLSVTSSGKNLQSNRVTVMAGFLLALFGVGGVWWFLSEPNVDHPVPLANLSFENVSPISNHPTMNGWYGDVARIVRGSSGNWAQDGEHMLQLIRSVHQPSGECEVYQTFSLCQVIEAGLEYPAFIEARVAVNARGKEDGRSYTLALQLFTSQDAPQEQQLLAPELWNRDFFSAGKQVIADRDRDSWQEIRLVMPLFKEARFGIVRISVRDDSNLGVEDFSEIFVDNVRVRVRNQEVL